MFTSFNISSIYVLDQDDALDFYVGKLGLEIGADIDMGFMRWLTVQVPGHPERQVLLELPSSPPLDEESVEQVRELVSKGAMGFTLGLVTDDCRKTYEALKEKGVEMTGEPTEHFYGIDCGIRDPFGNNLRFVEPKVGAETPSAEELKHCPGCGLQKPLSMFHKNRSK